LKESVVHQVNVTVPVEVSDRPTRVIDGNTGNGLTTNVDRIVDPVSIRIDYSTGCNPRQAKHR